MDTSSESPFRHGDGVRLTCEVEGIVEGSRGEVIGWYANEPERVLLLLEGGDELQQVPVESLELVSRRRVRAARAA